MTRITKITYTCKPTDKNEYAFTITTENFNPETETIILKISTDFFFPVYNPESQMHELSVPSSALPVQSRTVATSRRIRIFAYDFKIDVNIYTALGQINLYGSTANVSFALKTANLTETEDDKQPWVSGLSVTEVKGPFQDNKLVGNIDLNKKVSYQAFIGNKKFSRAQFLTIRWSYSIDGGPKKRFKNQRESTDESITNYASMECELLKEWAGKQVAVYAFFQGESERVVAKGKGQLGNNSVPPLVATGASTITFPLQVKPENDPGNKWGNSYHWAAAQRNNMTTYNSNRSGGRRHAARDLYTNPKESVVAVCDGVVLNVSAFYAGTDQVTVLHKTSDGKQFIVRYGELDPSSIDVKQNDVVTQNQKLGATGKLVKANGSPLLTIGGTVIYMLHFELFTGTEGLNLNKKLTNTGIPPFMRRADLKDPIDLLQEGYNARFNAQAAVDNRKDISNMTLSAKGIDFIKSWEAYRKNAYNDSEGYCTIGYGHLIAKKRCENLTLPAEFKNGVSVSKATELLKQKVQEFEISLKKDIKVPLYQHEFDALMSLVYNTGPNFLSKGGRGGGPTQIMKKINSQDYAAGAQEFRDVTNGGVTGLVNRRKAEIEIFLNNNYVNH